MNRMEKVFEVIGRPVQYVSVVPGHSTITAFISSADFANDRVDVLALDESKKELLNTLNWPQAFRIFHDVPHATAPAEDRKRHYFEVLASQDEMRPPINMAQQNSRPRPTIAELEEMLNSEEDVKVVVNPDGSVSAVPGPTETKHYADGSSATGPAPLPDHSPEEQRLAEEAQQATAPPTE